MVNHPNRSKPKGPYTPKPWNVFSWPTNNGGDKGDPWCYGFDMTRRTSPLIAEHEANARLMTAAPDLYEALERLTTILVEGDGDPMGKGVSVSAVRKLAKLVRAVDAAQAALAKARGE